MKRIRTGDHYRARAEECRTLSEWLTQEELREKMLRVAYDYEIMAYVADNIHAQKEDK